MSTIMDTVTEVETKVLDQLTEMQNQLLELIKKAVAALEERMPERAEFPEQLAFLDKVPTLSEIVDTQFAFSKKLLANNEKFAKNVVKTIKPLTREAPKPAKATAAA